MAGSRVSIDPGPDGIVEVATTDIARGVSSGVYESFVNLPDERYPFFEIIPAAASVELVFASNYDENGTRHVLASLTPPWLAGIVVGNEPGEYPPNALDDLAGNNFQILAGALCAAASQSALAMSRATAGFSLTDAFAAQLADIVPAVVE